MNMVQESTVLPQVSALGSDFHGPHHSGGVINGCHLQTSCLGSSFQQGDLTHSNLEELGWNGGDKLKDGVCICSNTVQSTRT